ncbi:MAG: DUF262 domain-containing protein [Thermoplasmataceae archaeon]
MEFRRSPTNQDISWFLDLEKTNQLDLDPPYQRKSVWTAKDRKFLLDTIFRGYPIPAIYLTKEISKNGESVYHVVDGKQRLETILMFSRGEIKIASNFGDITLDGKRWEQLAPESKEKFWNYVIPVEMINFSDTGLVREVFDRLNRNSRKLTPQELRHAKFDGWFASFVEEEVENPLWRKIGLIKTKEDKRMDGTQRLSELLFVILENRIMGFDQDELDRLYGKYDEMDEEDSQDEQSEISISQEEFREKLETAKTYLAEMEGKGALTKYAKTMANLYTLWSVIALNTGSIPSTNVLSKGYTSFMSLVEDLKKEPDSVLNSRTLVLASAYLKNSVGASTDLRQRKERYNALLEGVKWAG